jgi:hypothetical protein
MNKQWIWYDAMTNTTQGAIADLDAGIIQWIDAPGCACGDSMNEQTFADFIMRGARYLAPPDDVQAEMRELIQRTTLEASQDA